MKNQRVINAYNTNLNNILEIYKTDTELSTKSMQNAIKEAVNKFAILFKKESHTKDSRGLMTNAGTLQKNEVNPVKK